jgi:hypothetical protein
MVSTNPPPLARRTLLFAVLAALCIRTGRAQPVDSLLQDPASLWQTTQETFTPLALPFGFQWNSLQRESARAVRPEMTLGPLPVVELNARFTAQTLTSLTLLLYSSGDSGGTSREAYETLIRNGTEFLSALTRSKPQARGQDPNNAVRADGLVWKTPGTLWTLEFSITRKNTPQGPKFFPEFVRLELTPEKAPRKPGQTAAQTAALKPKQKVRKLPSGDVFIEGIPMVDQGRKGYCFPASAERVLRYHGMRVDQHEIAQLAGNMGSGTSQQAGIEGLKTAGTRLQFRVRPIDQFSTGLESFLKEYNRQAARYGPKFQIPPLQGVVDVQALYASLRPDIFAQARQAQKLEKNRFLRALQGSIDEGHPLMWCVALGLAREQTPALQTAGGHARLLVGYNAKTQECLYSDSWGAGHELKRMGFDDAWLMHQCCFLLIPQGIESPSLSQDR